MAVTQSQSKVPASATNIAVGSYLDTGTAAAITITCGFKPRYVCVYNVTAASTGLVKMEWFEGMTAAHGIKTNDEGTSETGITKITSLGITVSDSGFVIGLDTDLNVTSEQLHWMAIG
jgi:hypothetical protein